MDKQLVFVKNGCTITGFSDSSFADLDTFHSTGCSFIFIGTNLVIQYSRKQKLITTSTYESEILELVRCTKEVIFIRGFLEEMKLLSKEPAILFTDAKIIMDNIKTDLISKRSKHFCTKVYFLKQNIGFEIVKLCKIPSNMNIADMGTKPLVKDKFLKYQRIIFNLEERVTYLGRCVSEYSAGKYVTAPYREDVSYVDVLKEYNVLYEQDDMMERWIQFMNRRPVAD